LKIGGYLYGLNASAVFYIVGDRADCDQSSISPTSQAKRSVCMRYVLP